MKKLMVLNNIGCQFTIRHGFFRVTRYDALEDVTFDIFQGETLGIVGANGSGKSTLIKIIAGVILPDRGGVITSRRVSCSILAMSLGFDPELTGRENSLLGLMFLGFTKQRALARVQKIVEYADLGSWIDEPMRTYSTGMSARLGFAVALENEADILLIDEVLGVGDREFQNKSIATIKQRIKNNQTVVFVSHDEKTVREICDRVVWLEKGRLRLIGNADDVLNVYTGV